MCHDYGSRDWSRTADEEPDEEPSLPDREPAEDVEIVTDGGDKEE